jgi:hypothetical protein
MSGTKGWPDFSQVTFEKIDLLPFRVVGEGMRHELVAQVAEAGVRRQAVGNGAQQTSGARPSRRRSSWLPWNLSCESAGAKE